MCPLIYRFRLFIYHACVYPFSILGFKICPSTMANCRFGRTNQSIQYQVAYDSHWAACPFLLLGSLYELVKTHLPPYVLLPTSIDAQVLYSAHHDSHTPSIGTLEDLLECSNTLGFLKGPLEG
jgi:hypothetical protein